MINKWTILLLFLVIVGGGIYLIPQIEPEVKVLHYKTIEKDPGCGHYNVTLTNGHKLHVSIRDINTKDKTVKVKSCFEIFCQVLLWAILVVYVIAQIVVWCSGKWRCDSDFSLAWWEYSHRSIPEEHKQAFRNFFGYQ